MIEQIKKAVENGFKPRFSDKWQGENLKIDYYFKKDATCNYRKWFIQFKGTVKDKNVGARGYASLDISYHELIFGTNFLEYVTGEGLSVLCSKRVYTRFSNGNEICTNSSCFTKNECDYHIYHTAKYHRTKLANMTLEQMVSYISKL